MNKDLNQHVTSLLETLAGMLASDRLVKQFRLIMAVFLDCQLRTTLANVKGISASSASRFFSAGHFCDDALWKALNGWQFKQWQRLLATRGRGRRRDVVLKIDLTCVEKTGKKLPFVRVFNRKQGIQLVVLHACVEGLSLPLGYRLYRGKGTKTPVVLALELLAAFPARRWTSQVVVMADAGFASSSFIRGCNTLGYSRLLLGIRCDRKLTDERRLDQLTRRGQQQHLRDLDLPVWISWCDVKRAAGKKRFYLLSTFQATGAYLARRYRKRWLIESFFKSVKHDFGLKEARLRTPCALKLWLFLACLAYCLASLHRRHCSATNMSILAAAQIVLQQLTDVMLLHLLIDIERLTTRLRQPLKLIAV